MASIAIVIGQGTLGTELARVLRAQRSTTIVEVLQRPEVDITDPMRVHEAIERCLHPLVLLKPRAAWSGAKMSSVVVFNTAAYTAVDRAESEPVEAMRVNAIGAQNVAEECARSGISLVHFSTDAVFGEANGQTELDLPVALPPTAYGSSKLLGERLVMQAHPAARVVRVGNLYGDAGKSWPSRLRSMLLAGGDVVADCHRRVAPTWARWVAEVTATVMTHHWSPGVYHVCAAGSTTWSVFAQRMAAELRVDVRVRDRWFERSAPLGSNGWLRSVMMPLQRVDVPTWEQLLSRYIREERGADVSSNEVQSV